MSQEQKAERKKLLAARGADRVESNRAHNALHDYDSTHYRGTTTIEERTERKKLVCEMERAKAKAEAHPKVLRDYDLKGEGTL